MIEIGPMPGDGRPAVAPAAKPRLTERHVLALGLALSGGFVLAAVAFGVATALTGGATWAALHLALAGGAVTAIGTFMPHFAITLGGTRPEPAAQRIVGLALLAGGGLLAVVGIEVVGGAWAAAGAVAMIAGLALTGWQTIAPLRSPFARRHPVVTVAYLVALAELAVGVALGGMGAAGVEAVTSAWSSVRPAHAWLTLFGAVSVTIFGTLVYLAPTILGARIRPSAMLAAGTGGMLVGPIVTAAGFVLGSPIGVGAGMAVTLAGAVGQAGYVVDVVRRRGPYTSEHDWRRVAAWHVTAGPAWFGAAVAVALAEVLAGRPIAAWSLGSLAIPLVAGWMFQELVGSWTHLAPSVLPGGPAEHAAQRRALAPASRVRLVAWNAGVGLAWAGVAAGVPAVAAVGGVALVGSVVASVVLLARALTVRGY